MIDAIAFKFRTGAQWVHLPEKYGTWPEGGNRLRMWAVDGPWERVFTTCQRSLCRTRLSFAQSLPPFSSLRSVISPTVEVCPAGT